MPNGLRCPLCGSWYSTDPAVINSGMSAGDVCGNQSMTGPHPDKCSPEHPCPGILVPALPKRSEVNRSIRPAGETDAGTRGRRR
jgi:hypothetical protein